MEKQKIGYVIYSFDKDKVELKIEREKEGKKNKETKKNLNCLYCKGPTKYLKKDEYINYLKYSFFVLTAEQIYGKINW